MGHSECRRATPSDSRTCGSHQCPGVAAAGASGAAPPAGALAQRHTAPGETTAPGQKFLVGFDTAHFSVRIAASAAVVSGIGELPK